MIHTTYFTATFFYQRESIRFFDFSPEPPTRAEEPATTQRTFLGFLCLHPAKSSLIQPQSPKHQTSVTFRRRSQGTAAAHSRRVSEVLRRQQSSKSDRVRSNLFRLVCVCVFVGRLFLLGFLVCVCVCGWSLRLVSIATEPLPPSANKQGTRATLIPPPLASRDISLVLSFYALRD
jgi:hypothetical protein